MLPHTLKKKHHRKSDHRMFSQNRSCVVVDPLVDPRGAAIQHSDLNLTAASFSSLVVFFFQFLLHLEQVCLHSVT